MKLEEKPQFKVPLCPTCKHPVSLHVGVCLFEKEPNEHCCCQRRDLVYVTFEDGAFPTATHLMVMSHKVGVLLAARDPSFPLWSEYGMIWKSLEKAMPWGRTLEQEQALRALREYGRVRGVNADGLVKLDEQFREKVWEGRLP
jgi:hypothetical protein